MNNEKQIPPTPVEESALTAQHTPTLPAEPESLPVTPPPRRSKVPAMIRETLVAASVLTGIWAGCNALDSMPHGMRGYPDTELTFPITGHTGCSIYAFFTGGQGEVRI